MTIFHFNFSFKLGIKLKLATVVTNAAQL